MSLLSKYLVENIIGNQIAIFGGGFKFPTIGHFNLIKKALETYPNLDEFLVYIGSGVRNGISQAESILIWEIYRKYLPSKVKFIPTSSPVRAIYDYAKEHPNENIKWILGSREGQESDFAEYIKRTSHSKKYPNIETINLVTTGDVVSGTKARSAAKVSKEEFYKYIPSELSPEEKLEVYKIVSDVLLENQVKETTFIGRLGLKWDKFLDALKNEKKETQEAFDLLLKSSKGEIQLSPEQKKQIVEQLKSTFKSIGFIGLLALPGGTVFLLLLKFLKLHKFVTPNSFKKEELHEKINYHDRLVKMAQRKDPDKLTDLGRTYLNEKTNPEGFELEDEFDYQGLHIMIENDKGSVRKGVNEDGTPWETKMIYPYGYISRTKAHDNEHVDCYVGDNRDSNVVFIVHQVVPETGEYDEDKVMLGFDEAEEAKQAYLDHYDSPDFFGSMTEMTFEQFKTSLKENKGKKLQENMDLNNKPVNVYQKIKNYISIITQDICNELGMPIPKIKLIISTNYILQNHSFGGYLPGENQIELAIKGRNCSDILRTLCHECYHGYQDFKGELNDESGDDGSEHENQANSFSGKKMREYNRKYPEILTLCLKNEDLYEEENRIKIKEYKTLYKEYVLTEIFDKDLPFITNTSPNNFIVSNNKDIEALYRFKLDSPELDVWSVHWNFTENNKNTTPEAWKQTTATSYKVLKQFIDKKNPKTIIISGDNDSKTSLYKSKSYYEKLENIFNNKYKIDNSSDFSLKMRLIGEIYKKSINEQVKSQKLDYTEILSKFENLNLYATSKIERWNAIKQKVKREILWELYDIK